MSEISPEEKLLRLIRGKTPKPPASEASRAKLGIILKSNIQRFRPRAETVLWAAVIAAGLYTAYSFAEPILTWRAVPTDPPMTPAAEIRPPSVSAQSVEHYLEGVHRASFKEGAAAKVLSEAPAPDPERMKDLALVAIISDGTPEAVIEDKNAKKTYQVKEGEFAGDFKVEKISGNKVILNHKGNSYDLTI